jgi:hypothetical protein
VSPIADPGPPPEKKRGRPSKREREEREKAERFAAEKAEQERREAAAKEIAPTLSTLVAGIFGIVAKRCGEHWKLDTEEEEKLGTAGASVVVKYIDPTDVLKYKEELVLFYTAVAVLRPRVEKERELRAARKGNPRKVGEREIPASDAPTEAA